MQVVVLAMKNSLLKSNLFSPHAQLLWKQFAFNFDEVKVISVPVKNVIVNIKVD